MKVIVHSSKKCGFDLASIASKDFVSLMLYCSTGVPRKAAHMIASFFILECQPDNGGWSYCK